MRQTSATESLALALRTTIVRMWIDGVEFDYNEIDYGSILAAAKTDARIDADEVLALAVDIYPDTFYTYCPWACPTCKGDKVVEVQTVAGSWGSMDGPMLDIDEEPCPTCVGDAGDRF